MSGFGFGTRSGLHRASGSRNDPRITISAFAISEDALPGSTVGILSVTAGSGSYTFSIAAGGDPDNKFALSGDSLVTTGTLDFETAAFHQVTIEADNGVDAVLSRTLTLSVTNAFEQPDLSTLSISNSLVQGSSASILGATSGSTIVALILPEGWTLDGPGREISIDIDAPLGSQDWILLETLSDSANSPNPSNGSTTIEAPVVAPTLTALTLAATATQGTTIAISGATAGSTITGTMPTGWTLDGLNRQIAIASDATLGSQSWSLTEALSGATNTPNTSSGSTTVSAPAATRPFVVIALLGQSNMAGFAPLGAQDVDVPGIFQFGGQALDLATFDQITSDITPLLHPRTQGGFDDTTKQLGPGDYLARQLKANGYVEDGYDLLVVSCARGGTSLIVGNEEWKPTDPFGELMQNAIDRCTNAVNAAQAINSASYFAGFAWGQGENEAGSGSNEDDYLTAFNQVVAQMRSNVPTAQDCWVMINSFTPELSKQLSGAPAIDAALRRAVLEGENIHFTQGPVGQNSDFAHYNAAGYRTLGTAAANELIARLADPALRYDFTAQTVDETEILGATQRGGTNFTIRDGRGSGAEAKSLTAMGAATLPSLGTTGLRFEAVDGLEDMQVEWSSNTDGQQAVTLRASGAHGSTLGPDGYLIGIDGTGTGSVGLFIVSGGSTGAAVAGSTDLGLTGSTARFRASALGSAITFEVSNDDGATWSQAFTHTDATFSSGDLVYMQGGNGTTGNQIFAYDFEVRNIAPAVTLGALTLPASVQQGQLVAITGATAGSTITATTLPTGWTLDSAARTIAIASDATLGSQSWAFSEALTGATNTPNPSSGSSTVGASTGFSFTNIEASNFVAAMTVAPNNTRKGAIDQLVTALKAANLLPKMDALWLADAHDDQAARLNLINPASNVITGAATFAAGTGYTGNTANALNTNFALDGGENYSNTSASIFVHSPNSNSSTGQIFGYASGSDITFSPATDAGGWFGRIGDGVGGTPSFSAGLSVLTYDNGTTRAYNNGTLGDTDTRDRRDVTPSENLTLFGGDGSFTGYTISSAGVASSLSASEIADLDTALAAYRAAIASG